MNSKISQDHIAMAKRAAKRNGVELTEAEAQAHAARILEWTGGADAESQEFWDAAKEYFSR